MKLHSVTDRYINYLREDNNLKNVFSNKEDTRIHSRKYLGAVFDYNGFKYFIPLASPKKSDYILKGKKEEIRKSIIPIIRITVLNREGVLELKGTLKISNMIPVPSNELIEYNIDDEKDKSYQGLLKKEYRFIRKNSRLIRRNAEILYKQKVNEKYYYSEVNKKPGYLDSTVEFKLAEKRCEEFIKEYINK